MGSALKQQMYKRGAGFIWLQCTVLFHSHYQLETDKLPSCSGTKCDVVQLSPTRRAASGRGRGGRWRRPLAVVWDRLKSCGSQHAATTLSWLFPPQTHSRLRCFFFHWTWIRIWRERERGAKKSQRRGVTDKGSSCCGLNKTRSEEKGRIGLKECTKKGGRN